MRIAPQDRKRFLKESIKQGLKLLTYDTETSHMLVRTFYIGQKVSIQHSQIKVPSKVISIQYKWANEKQVKYLVWDKVGNQGDVRDFDDSQMIEQFCNDVLSKADIVVTQNGDKFDFMVLNERAKALHLSIVDQKPSIDILKLSRKSFRAASHKLDYRSNQQGLGGKIKMIDEDWVNIEELGIPAEKKMIPYGCKDTSDTEKLMWDELEYYKDLPVIVERTLMEFNKQRILKKPNIQRLKALFCPRCRQHKHKYLNIEKTERKGLYHCLNCRGFFNEKDCK